MFFLPVKPHVYKQPESISTFLVENVYGIVYKKVIYIINELI